MNLGDKLFLLMRLKQAIGEFEETLPREVAQAKCQAFIAGLPESEWTIIEELVEAITTPQAVKFVGADSVLAMNRVYEAAKEERLSKRELAEAIQ